MSSFKVPLLDKILSQEESEIRQVVLDLGGPSQVLLNRLGAARPCRVEIVDLFATGGVAALAAPDAFEDPRVSPVADLLPEASEPVDLILCWDLPNYLSLQAFGHLCAAFAARAAPGCRLHMLIAYSRRDMAARPARYQLRQDGQLTQICANAEVISAPRYSPEDIGAAVDGFRYERGVLLANGMQEFVYVWPQDDQT